MNLALPKQINFKETKVNLGQNYENGQKCSVFVNLASKCRQVSTGFYFLHKSQLIYNKYIYHFKTMEKGDCTPKSFLKTKQMRQKYQCGICFEVCIKPTRCKGPCGRIYCMKCVSDSRQVLDRCPNRCSAPFYVEPIPDIEIDFFCPYNPSECRHSIKTLKAFNEHYLKCEYVSPEEVHLKMLQKQYKCLRGHQLQFFIGSYQEMISSICAQCNEQKLCRSYCRICQKFYCVSCRVPPCSKEGCPIGHSYNFQRIANINYICDICGISTAVSNDGVYDDNHCNFGICEACYSQLPDKFDQSKPKSIIANINTRCSCGQTLIYRNRVHSPSACELCKRVKQCPKYCTNCELGYCVDCKLMDIHSDHTCALGHTIARTNLSNHEAFRLKQNLHGCMKCGSKHNEYFYDQKCFIRLCGKCYEYCMKVTTDKERPVLLKCEKSHALMYINGPEDHMAECCICREEKIVKLACNYCEEDMRFYCFQCRPIPLKTCYYLHELLEGTFEQPRECHFCIQEGKDFFYCKKCLFFVCKACEKSNREHYMEEEQQQCCQGCEMQEEG